MSVQDKVNSCLSNMTMIAFTNGSSPKELVDEKDSRGQGFKDSSEMLKNYKELKALSVLWDVRR